MELYLVIILCSIFREEELGSEEDDETEEEEQEQEDEQGKNKVQRPLESNVNTRMDECNEDSHSHSHSDSVGNEDESSDNKKESEERLGPLKESTITLGNKTEKRKQRLLEKYKKLQGKCFVMS